MEELNYSTQQQKPISYLPILDLILIQVINQTLMYTT